MNKLLPLAFLLAPMMTMNPTASDDDKYPLVYTRYLRPEDWVTFLDYAKRIRHLELDCGSLFFGAYVLHHSALVQMVESCPETAFPRVTTFVLKGLHDSLIAHVGFFCSGNLKNFHLPSHEIPASHFSLDICNNSPGITTLHLGGVHGLLDKTTCDEDMPLFFSKLSCLTNLYMTNFTLSRNAFSSLASLPMLRVIRPQLGYTYTDVSSDTGGIYRLDSEDAFPALVEFHLQGDLAQIGLAFSSPGAYKKLLVVEVLHFGSVTEGCACFLEALAQSSPLLQKLSIFNGNTHFLTDAPTDDAITFDTMRALSCFTQLQELVFEDVTVVDTTDSQFVDILMHCPSLSNLCLYRSAALVEKQAPSLTLRVFALLAEHCPQISDLTLIVDANVAPAATCTIPPFFHNLRHLDLDCSHLPANILPVIIYLSMMLPDECTVKGSNSFEHELSWQYSESKSSQTDRLSASEEEFASLKAELSSLMEEKSTMKLEIEAVRMEAVEAKRETQDMRSKTAPMNDRISGLQRLVSEQSRAIVRLFEIAEKATTSEKAARPRSRKGRG
ncbi:hypothetical protein DFH11DRAFT_1305755 [Phellopilus nigrolimitatus]|nr:hypothetical protein DFH11DRAFT_1305755 [Phellopilus nigrolimitatus]